MSYIIKQIPEDFIVEELPKLNFDASGSYTYSLMEKRGFTTLKAIQVIARAIDIDAKRIGYAGNKDKQAITTQAVSLPDIPHSRISGLMIPGITLVPIGKGKDPLRLGDLEGNKFTITVREIDNLPTPTDRYINYFGSQRFGRHNASIGRALLRRKYLEAITLICESSPDFADDLHSFLANHPTNPIGALRLIPKTLLMLYVHAYQASLWNEAVELYLKAGGLGSSCPLIGFATTITDKPLAKLIEEIMVREGLTFRDFVFRDIPELCAEGKDRQIFVEVKDLKIGALEKNNLGQKSKATISFTLPPGSFATIFIEQLFR